MNLFSKIEILDRNLLKDERGWFLKIMTGKENHLPDRMGEIYLTNARPGSWRANHYHPLTSEWFSVIKGKAKVILEDTFSKERLTLKLSSENPQTLYVPPGIAHVFINEEAEDDMLLVVFSENLYVPEDTIIYDLIGTNEF